MAFIHSTYFMAATGNLLDQALANNSTLTNTSFANSVTHFRELSQRDDACDVFVWRADIKNGTHIKLDVRPFETSIVRTVVFAVARFFVCDASSHSLDAIYAVSENYVRNLPLVLAKFYMVPIKETTNLLSDGIVVTDAMDVDMEDDVENTPDEVSSSGVSDSVCPIKWRVSHPFSFEAGWVDRNIIDLYGDEYGSRMETPICAYLQLMKEALVHLCVSPNVYEHGLSNFHALYTQQFAFWTSNTPGKNIPACLSSYKTIPTMDSTRMFFLKHAGYTFDEQALVHFCDADAALCAFENLLEMDRAGSDLNENILAALSEFEEFTCHLRILTGHSILPGRAWWEEVSPAKCIMRGKDDVPRNYCIPYELALKLNVKRDMHNKHIRWPGLRDNEMPPSVTIRLGRAVINTRDMALFVLPVLRKLITRETLAVHRAIYYSTMGATYFSGASHLEGPRRITEARARQHALDIADAARCTSKPQKLYDIDDDDIVLGDTINESLLADIAMLIPPIDWNKHDLLDTLEYANGAFLVYLPVSKSVDMWKFSDICNTSPTLGKHGFSSLWIDETWMETINLQRTQMKHVELANSGMDGWRIGEVSRLVPDIADFASDGVHFQVLPPCMQNLATLAPPKKTAGKSRLTNNTRLATASLYLRLGYDRDQVTYYMSDGSEHRTAEAAGIISSHIAKYFHGGDFTDANENGILWACPKMIEDAHTSPSSCAHCPYAAADRTASDDDIIRKCSMENLPNYHATGRSMTRHPLFLLWKRLKAAQT